MPESALADTLRSRWITILLALATIGLALRLLHLIDLHAVDLLFYDQLDLYEVFLDDPSAWDLFRYQHGPHRQGLPYLGTWWLARLTDWNARADAFHVAAWIMAATGLALWLRRRLFGPFTATDVAIPLLLLTPAQYGIFTHAPNASHGAAPLALLMLLCHALLIADRRLRYAALVVLDFVMLHTGFAIFAGGQIPLLLLLAAHRDRREGRHREAGWALVGVLLCLASIGVFLVGYTSQGGLDAIGHPASSLLYASFVAYMFANVLGAKDPGALTLALGSLVALATLSVALRQLARTIGQPETRDPRERASASVCFVLTSFSLLFAVATAIGRIDFGLWGSQSTRYVPLMAPAFLGLYLALCRLRTRGLRLALGGLAVVALVQASFPMHPLEERFMKQLAQKKRSWVASYRETGSVEQASRVARLRIDPYRNTRRSTDETFAHLREHRLSFFADR